MIRKSITCALFLLSTPAFSMGFYAGAGIGPEDADFTQRARIASPGDFDARDAVHLSGTGLFGSIFGGYAWKCHRFYLAGEANANVSSTKFNSSNKELLHSNFSSTHYRMRNSIGLSILPGFLFTDSTLFYTRFGMAKGNFRINTSDTSLANVNRHLNGFRFGLGIKQNITQNISLRMEYSHINYHRTRFTVIDPPVVKTTHIRPETGQVEFGLAYEFC